MPVVGVFTQQVPVEPGAAPVVHPLEPEDDSPALPLLRHTDGAAVPSLALVRLKA